MRLHDPGLDAGWASSTSAPVVVSGAPSGEDPPLQFLDAVLDCLHDGVVACAADGTIVLLNERMRRLWGDAELPGDETVVEDLFDAAGGALKRTDMPIFRALRGEHLHDEELVLHDRTGHTRYFLVDARPITGPDGRPAGAVQSVQDVTRRRRAERFRTCELG